MATDLTTIDKGQGAIDSSQKLLIVFYIVATTAPAAIITFFLVARLLGEVTGSYQLSCTIAVLSSLLLGLSLEWWRRKFTTVDADELIKLREDLEISNIARDNKSGGASTDVSVKEVSGAQTSWQEHLERGEVAPGCLVLRLTIEKRLREMARKNSQANWVDSAGNAKLIEKLRLRVEPEADFWNQLLRLNKTLSEAIHGKTLSADSQREIVAAGQAALSYLEKL